MDRVIRLVRTMVWLRWRLLFNTLGTVRGLGETVAGVLVLLLGAVVAILGAVGAGLAVFSGLSGTTPEDARLVLGVAWAIIGMLALLIPVMIGEGRAELAPRRLLQFPVSRGDLFWTGLAGGALSGANLVWYPAMAATVLAALLTGPTPPLPLLAAAALATASILAAQQALLMGVQWIAANRRLRELATVVAILAVVLLGQLPAILNQAGGGAPPGDGLATHPLLTRVLLGLAASLPPALAARLAIPGDVLHGLTGLLGLLLWGGLGLGIAWKLYLGGLERHAGGGRSSHPAHGGRQLALHRLLDAAPPDVAALAAKQFRYTLRSTSGRVALAMSPVAGLILAFMQRNAPSSVLGLPIHDTVFLFLCLMAAINVSQLTANCFQWDGRGAGLYFVAPVAPRRILLGLNLGLWLFQALTTLGILASYVIVTGLPKGPILLSGLMLLLGAQTVAMVAGNVLSILAPSPRDMGTSRNHLPLLSSLVMLGVTAATMAGFGLPTIFLLRSHPRLAPAAPFLLLLAAAALYRLMLPSLGRLLAAHREALLSALESRPG